MCSKTGLDKLESFLRHKAEKSRRCRTVAKASQTSRYGVGPSEEIKRRLSFDNDNEDDTKKSPSFSPSPSLQVTKSLPNTWREGECYCRCGQLLGNCEDCSVDIDIDKLVVSFSLCCNLNDADSHKNGDGDEEEKRVNGDLNGYTNYFNEFDSPVVSRETMPEIYIHGSVLFFILLSLTSLF